MQPTTMRVLWKTADGLSRETSAAQLVEIVKLTVMLARVSTACEPTK